MRFTLTIELGSIETIDDVVTALQRYANTSQNSEAIFTKGETDYVHDLDGKKCGQWKIEADPEPMCKACKGYGNVTKRDKGGKYITTCLRCNGTGFEPDGEEPKPTHTHPGDTHNGVLRNWPGVDCDDNEICRTRQVMGTLPITF